MLGGAAAKQPPISGELKHEDLYRRVTMVKTHSSSRFDS